MRLQITIIDDDKAILDDLKEEIEDFCDNSCLEEIRLMTFVHPAHFIEKIDKDKDCSGLFIIDYHMPQYNGIQLCKKILERNSEGKIIFYTGNVMHMKQKETSLIERHNIPIFTKGIERSLLMARVKKYLTVLEG